MMFLLYLLGLLFIGAVALFVATPLFRAEARHAWPGETGGPLTRWEKQKADAYAAIKEAELDHRMGKLTEEDYWFLREKDEARALEALAQLDRLRRAEP
jgi:hypothetical protein